MIIYPAIDLKEGHVVRLQEGDPSRKTIFNESPKDAAKEWQSQGAEWIHIVNLDGALDEKNDNISAVKDIVDLGINVQFGGGLRSMEDIQNALKLGVSRVVLGTIAAQQPDIVREAVDKFGSEKICVALDARDGKIATHGWTTLSEMTPESLGKEMVKIGVQHALFTDVSRDGLMEGGNVDATIDLARKTGLKIIASGGISRVNEVRALAGSHIVAGAVIGMALYRGLFTLSDALKAAELYERGRD